MSPVAAARHSNQRITLVMLVLISITVLTLDYHGEASHAIGHIRNGFATALSPIQRGIQATLHPVGDLFSASIHYGSLEAENARLRAENGDLQRELYANTYAEHAAASLKALSGLPFVGSLQAVPAQVAERASSNFASTVEISVGSSEGVGAGMPVVAEQGLIGTVISASSTTAVVQLVDDTRQTIGVADTSGRTFLLSGQGGDEPLSLRSGGATSAAPNVGAELETTGQTNDDPSSIYPAGIPVGIVRSVHAVPGNAVSGTAVPVVNLDTLDFVEVLLWAPSA